MCSEVSHYYSQLPSAVSAHELVELVKVAVRDSTAQKKWRQGKEVPQPCSKKRAMGDEGPQLGLMAGMDKLRNVG